MPVFSAPFPSGEPELLLGREPPVLNLIMFARGWTYSVSMPSAAPISGVGVVRVETVSLGGTVKERVIAMRRGVAGSGVHGVVGVEVDIAVVCRVQEYCC